MTAKTPTRDALFLDDLSVGQTFVTASHEIDAAQIKAFAAQFDPQPFHLDETLAKDTIFKELVASGWHTMAITMRLLVQSGLPLEGGLIGMGATLEWPRPTRPGDTLTVYGEVREITPSRSRPDRGTAGIVAETRNQRDEVVQIFTARLVVPRRVSQDV